MTNPTTEVKKPPSLTPPVGNKAKPAGKADAMKNAPVGDVKPAKPPKAPKEPKAAKEPKESAGAGAPRPRKHEYGIKPDALVVAVAEQAEAAKRAGVAKAYEFTKANDDGSPITVEAFYARGGNRHDLRVMSRRGLIKIKWTTGEEFPQAAVQKAPEAPQPSDAATVEPAVSDSAVETGPVEGAPTIE
jgi:hypothetical protein